MSLINKSVYDILTEASACGDLDCDELEIDDLEGELDDTFEDIEEIDDDDLQYTEEMVHIIDISEGAKTSLENGATYLIESDNLAKFMRSANISDVSEAVERIAGYYSKTVEEMCIVIESPDSLYRVLEEARKIKSPLYKKKIKDIKSSSDLISMLKTKGIKVAKKKSKRPKKKK